MEAVLGGVVAEPVAEGASVAVVAIDEGYVGGPHCVGCREHDFALCDIALGEEPGEGAACVDALYLGTGTGGHDDGQPVGGGIFQQRGCVVGVKGAYDGMARVVALTWQRKAGAKGFEVLGVLVVVAQVELDAARLLLLCLLNVGHSPVDAVLPLLAYVGGKDDVYVDGLYCGDGRYGGGVVVALAGGEYQRCH